MTEVSTTSPAPRRGVRVPVWVLIVVGVLVIGGGAFAVGRAIDDGGGHGREGRSESSQSFEQAGRQDQRGERASEGGRGKRQSGEQSTRGERSGDHGRHSGGRNGLGILVVVLLGAVLITGIVLLVRHFTGGRHDTAQPSGSPAMDILESRLARGEIDTEDFRRRRDALLD